MAKTLEELAELKSKCETLNNKLKELSDDELIQVTGGKDINSIKLGLSLNISVFYFERVADKR